MKPRSPLLALLVGCLVFAARVGGADSPAVVDRFGFHEITLLASGRYANPYLEYSAEATLTGPDRSVRKLPLFWDGDQTSKLRLLPDLVGEWQWAIASADSGLNGRRGGFTCRASSRRGSPAAHRDAPHHFAYQNGEPV